jgi:hypothetical protein
MMPTDDAIEEWRAHPVTEWFMDVFIPAEMNRTRAAFNEAAWSGQVDGVAHAAYRERHDTLEWVRTLDAETINHALESQGE